MSVTISHKRNPSKDINENEKREYFKQVKTRSMFEVKYDVLFLFKVQTNKLALPLPVALLHFFT